VSSAQYTHRDRSLYVDRVMALLAGGPRLLAAPDTLLVTPDDLSRVAPIRLDDVEHHAAIATPGPSGWTIKGKFEGGDNLVLRTKPADAEAGSWLIVQGRVTAGTLRIGLLENERWARSVTVTNAGEFIAVVEAPRPRTYSVVIAGGLSEPGRSHEVVLTSIGWSRAAQRAR
jgi:hypothetical protein